MRRRRRTNEVDEVSGGTQREEANEGNSVKEELGFWVTKKRLALLMRAEGQQKQVTNSSL